MIKYFLGFLTLVFLQSCSESFITRDTYAFNKKIAERTDIKTPEQLIQCYYPVSESEGKQTLSIQTDELGDNQYQVTFIQEGLQDDSPFGQKIVMTARKKGKTWIVSEIKENWKCQNGRGHRNWGIEPCN